MQDVVCGVVTGSDTGRGVGAGHEPSQETASERVPGTDRIHYLGPLYWQHRVPSTHCSTQRVVDDDDAILDINFSSSSSTDVSSETGG